ncbi:ricin-type beta-trefoil lectin domain protein [Cellulomonas sp. NPDC057328]|uniref:ricin-type beta-trefoil lectin domain protein n=1 Tax=Cellulomonas sp. NPDC057328 TaxID=3346101 RepID=UPI00363528C5
MTTTAGLAAVTAPPAAAVPADGVMPFASYNVQGALNGERWITDIAPLVRDFPVVALQEAGMGPPLPPPPPRAPSSTTGITHIPVPRSDPALPGQVTHSTWRVGTSRSAVQDVHVYFLQTHVNRHVAPDGSETFSFTGGRVNLAMVTHAPAEEVRVIENPAWRVDETDAYRSRPLLGVRFGSTWYFDVHARGGDVQGLLDEIRAAVPDHQSWVVAGDWNLRLPAPDPNLPDPDAVARDRTLHLRDDEALVRTGRPTQQSGGEIDYAVTHGLPPFHADVPAGHGSDHYPVRYMPVPAAPADTPTTATQTYSSVLESAPTGLQVDLTADGRVIVHPARTNDNQRFRQLTTPGFAQAFQNVRTGGCIGLPHLQRRAEGAPSVVAESCEDPRTHWVGEDLDAPGGPVQWRNVAEPEVCLQAPDRQGPLTAAACSGEQLQRFWTTSVRPESRGWDPVYTDVKLYNVALDEFLDVSRGRKGDNSGVQTHPDKSVDNQLWSLEAAEPGDNLVRLVGTDSGRCLDVQDSHDAGPGRHTVIYDCVDHGSKNDGRGHRWLAELYEDGSVRLRNEATHLCLSGGTRSRAPATVEACDDGMRQRWLITPTG